MVEAPATLRIALLGAESTGKTTLALELGRALAERTGARVAVVPEWLRLWCEARGRTPRAHEQADILREQHARIEAAAAAHRIVVCDTTGVMISVYSTLLFDDRSLDAEAAARHQAIDATLLTALDLPWVADGHLRDGEHVREPVDALVRDLLVRHGLPFDVIGGHGEARLAQALAALRPVLARAGLGGDGGATSARAPAAGGAGGGTAGHDAGGGAHRPALRSDTGAAARRWRCECCVPEAERAERAQRAERTRGRGPDVA